MINFHIPCFISNFNVNLTLLDMLNERPEMFYDDFHIASVFGNFPNCIWNGGRNIRGRYFPKEEQQSICEQFNSRGVPLRLVMSNLSLNEHDVYDRYANYIMSNLNNGFNQVIVASPILEEYIRKTYPEYPIVRSILGAENDYCDDSDKYHLSVLKRNKNIDLDFLKNIKNKDKIEILVNETCHKDCTREYEHYRALSNKQLYMDDDGDVCFYGDCKRNRAGNPFMINREQIKTIYEPMGFTNFKLAGRYNSAKTILDYTMYMVKPEHQYEFMEIMIHEVIKDSHLK